MVCIVNTYILNKPPMRHRSGLRKLFKVSYTWIRGKGYLEEPMINSTAYLGVRSFLVLVQMVSVGESTPLQAMVSNVDYK